MAGKLSFLVGLGAGYVLGARSGRERYDQIAGKAQELWSDPRVQEKAQQAQGVVKNKVGASGDKSGTGASTGSSSGTKTATGATGKTAS
jgi:hypothetical protein